METIAAISSATGPAARMILRISGPNAVGIAQQISPGFLPKAFSATRCNLEIRKLQFPAWVYCFLAPASYTGEDLIELHIPGNPLLAKITLERILSLGARLAEPGEFTARAYFAGKIDLTQAEGIAAAIEAGNIQQLSASRQLMSGELSRRLKPAMDELAELLGLIEVGIDFSEEDVQFISALEAKLRLERISADLNDLLRDSARIEKLTHEPRICLAGRPNAGKSTLINALAGRNRAIVSPIAGTTRDVLSAVVALRRGLVRLLDVAGLDESEVSQRDEISAQMRTHAQRAIAEANYVVLLRDIADSNPALELGREPNLVVFTKIDLHRNPTEWPLSPSPGTPGEGRGGGRAARESGQENVDSGQSESPPLFYFQLSTVSRQRPPPYPSPGVPGEGKIVNLEGLIAISALTGQNMDSLRDEFDRLAFGADAATTSLALSVRHIYAIERAISALAGAASHVDQTPEILASELRLALDSLGEILGAVSPDDLLGRIFSTFCIGK